MPQNLLTNIRQAEESNRSGSHVFDRRCEMHGIEHKLIPIGEKEISGKVENSHKYDDEEFYSFFRANKITELDSAVQEHNRVWNSERHTKTLGWRTPNESVEWAQLVALAQILAFRNLDLEKILRDQPKFETRLTQLGSITTRVCEKPKNTKRETTLNRYLQYSDWEDKKRLKSILVLPTISQIFPIDLTEASFFF